MDKKKILAQIILSVLVLLVVSSLVYFYLITQKSIFVNLKKENKALQILFTIEYSPEEDLSIPLSFLLLFNLETKNIGILEIPPYTGVVAENDDLMVPIDYLYKTGGYKEYLNTVESNLQAGDLPYILITKDELAHFIDSIGGLRIFLLANNLTVEEGANVGDTYFDGDDVVQYVKFMERTQSIDELLKSSQRKELISAILQQFISNSDSYVTSRRLVTMIKKYMNTSLKTNELQEILGYLHDYNLDNLYFQRIAGEIRAVDFNNNGQISKLNILFPSSEVGGISNTYKTLLNKLASSQSTNTRDKISITILNGTTTRGLARSTQEIYENAGFNVISIGNAENDSVEKTILIDRIGDKNNASQAAQVIGIKSIITDITSVDKAGAEITIILGNDFEDGKIK